MARLDDRARPPEESLAELFPLVYAELRRLAAYYLQAERAGHTLQPTALVHEAFVKLVDRKRAGYSGRTHFFSAGAQAMRRILVDHARRRRRAKRGGDWKRVTLSGGEEAAAGALSAEQLLALDEALDKLAHLDERQARVVELRYFGGLTVAEVAEALGVSKRSVEAYWTHARAWLKRELGASP